MVAVCVDLGHIEGEMQERKRCWWNLIEGARPAQWGGKCFDRLDREGRDLNRPPLISWFITTGLMYDLLRCCTNNNRCKYLLQINTATSLSLSLIRRLIIVIYLNVVVIVIVDDVFDYSIDDWERGMYHYQVCVQEREREKRSSSPHFSHDVVHYWWW